ncbi:unnamed protein product [Linum trigynum]|uniref:Uncharacterized protein n=1 Tax=Linum trigynum TaxID=586398 RepID=A0AAV2DWR9_9ROSI
MLQRSSVSFRRQGSSGRVWENLNADRSGPLLNVSDRSGPLLTSYSGPISAGPTSYSFLSPLSKWIAAPLLLRGPLFLASPPWKLLQSSTPLHLRGNGAALALLRKRRAEALIRLNSRLDSFKSRINSSSSAAVANTATPYGGIFEEESGRNSSAAEEWFWDSFVNWPNFILISRLVSGPFLGWMIANEMYSAAFVGLAISGASDWVNLNFCPNSRTVLTLKRRQW